MRSVAGPPVQMDTQEHSVLDEDDYIEDEHADDDNGYDGDGYAEYPEDEYLDEPISDDIADDEDEDDRSLPVARESFPDPPSRRRRRAPRRDRAGLYLAATIIGSIAAVWGAIPLLFGAIPLLSYLAVTGGLIALPLGLLGLNRVRRKIATTNKARTFVISAVAGLLALVLGIAGIAAANSPAKPVAKAPPVAGTQTEPDGTQLIAFGLRAGYPNGLTVLVEAPTTYKPSDYRLVPDGAARAVEVKITIANTGTAAADTSTWVVKALTNGKPATLINDGAKGVVGIPGRTLQTGTAVTFSIVVAVPFGPVDLRVDVAPSRTIKAASFGGSA